MAMSPRYMIALALAVALPLALASCTAVATPVGDDAATEPTGIDEATAEPTVPTADPIASDKATADLAPPPGFVSVLDRTGVLSVNVPSRWTDVESESSYTEYGVVYHLYASPDLDAAAEAQTPYFDFFWFEYPDWDPDAELDSMISNLEKDCDLLENSAYDDGLYVGIYAYFENCDGTDLSIASINVIDAGARLAIFCDIHMLSVEDKSTVLDEILRSFKLTL